MSSHYHAKGPIGAAVHVLEESIIAALLGFMTLLTFTNVILRYVFNESIIWSLEVVLVMFSWLVLFGISYCFKITAHLGVDAVTNLLPPKPRKAVALLAAALTIIYAMLLLKGCYDYWAPFADLPPTSGRWFPTGLDYDVRSTSFFETDQIPMLSFLRPLEDMINYGDSYSKLPRMIPYMMLPIAGALILFRVIQATGRIWRDEVSSLIVSHEAEDAVAEASLLNKDN